MLETTVGLLIPLTQTQDYGKSHDAEKKAYERSPYAVSIFFFLKRAKWTVNYKSPVQTSSSVMSAGTNAPLKTPSAAEWWDSIIVQIHTEPQTQGVWEGGTGCGEMWREVVVEVGLLATKVKGVYDYVAKSHTPPLSKGGTNTYLAISCFHKNARITLSPQVNIPWGHSRLKGPVLHFQLFASSF